MSFLLIHQCWGLRKFVVGWRTGVPRRCKVHGKAVDASQLFHSHDGIDRDDCPTGKHAPVQIECEGFSLRVQAGVDRYENRVIGIDYIGVRRPKLNSVRRGPSWGHGNT